MWTFFEDGTFYSAVQDENDKDVTWVRARDFRSAEKYAEAVGGEVLEWRGTDYAYRVKSSRDEWSGYVQEKIWSAEATNFKNEVARNLNDRTIREPFLHALHGVWGEMYDFQNAVRRDMVGAWSSTEDTY